MEIRTVAIVGSGAVGIYYGSRLHEAGHRVKFLLRSDYDEVCKGGFVVKSVDGDLTIPAPAVFARPGEMGQVDLVVVCWKATANDSAPEVIAPLLHAGTRILTLQNGLGNVELLEKLFGKGRVLGGLCFVCINRIAAGQVDHQGGGMIAIGEFHETGMLAEMKSLFGSRVKVTLADDLATAQWRKLVWNIPFNGLCVTSGGIDTQELLSEKGREDEVRELMREVIAAAAALGQGIPLTFIDEQIATTRKMGRYRPSSMLDFVAGNPIEVEAIWGEPLRRAREAGVAVPRLHELTRKLRELNPAR